MGSGDIVASDVGDETEDAVTVFRSAEIVVFDGPQDVVDRLVAGDPALRSTSPVSSTTKTAMGAIAALGPVLQAAAAVRGSSATGPTLFRLDPVGQAMFDAGTLAPKGDGMFRLFGRAADGTFSGHGAITPVTMAPQQLVTAQLAIATVALTAAIKEVQAAVERVESKVDLLRDLLDADRDGEILGANRSLRRRAAQLGYEQAMSDADWHAIDDIGIGVEQQIERLRSFVRKRVQAAEDEGTRITGRLNAIEHARDVAATLALLVVAQDSLFLFQQMRVLRIRTTEPEFAVAAADEARALLQEHATEDADLIDRLRTLVADRVPVEALEVVRFRTASEIARISPEVDETLSWFADQRGLRYEPIEFEPLPGAADVVDEVKERGAAIAAGGRRVIGGLASKVRSREQDADDAPALAPGAPTLELPSRSDGDDALALPPIPDTAAPGRIGKARARLGRKRSDPADDRSDDETSET